MPVDGNRFPKYGQGFPVYGQQVYIIIVLLESLYKYMYEEEVAYVIDGKTGQTFSQEDYWRKLSKMKDSKSAHKGSRFIRGPIPVKWLKLAVEVGAVPVALGLWYQAGLSKQNRFKLQPERLREVGVTSTASCTIAQTHFATG